MKINHNYHVLNDRWDNFRYFLKRGHFFHLLFDRFRWHWYPRLRILPRFPLTVDIETSLTCNLRCRMCTREQMAVEKRSGLMDFDLYKRIIDECAANGVHSVKLSWRGEPTVHKRLAEMVRYAKDKGIRDVAFLTNGGLITEEKAREFIEGGLDWISFSIDGLKEEYEQIRAPYKFEQIVATVESFRRIKAETGRVKPLVRIQTISSCIRRTPEYFDFWKRLADRVSCIAEQHRENPELIRHDPDYVCQAPFQRVFISWDGRVVPCHGDYFLHHDMGSVKERTIREIWMSEPFRRLREKMRKKERLDYEACRICPDGGEYVADTVTVEGRKVPIIRFLEKTEGEEMKLVDGQ